MMTSCGNPVDILKTCWHPEAEMWSWDEEEFKKALLLFDSRWKPEFQAAVGVWRELTPST